jgi:hypothetical protein
MGKQTLSHKMKITEGIDPRTGEYFYREHKPRKPREPEFELDFGKHIGEQLTGKCSVEDVILLVKLNNSRRSLERHGCLPGNRDRAVQKQITLKARAAIRKFNKSKQCNLLSSSATPAH